MGATGFINLISRFPVFGGRAYLLCPATRIPSGLERTQQPTSSSNRPLGKRHPWSLHIDPPLALSAAQTPLPSMALAALSLSPDRRMAYLNSSSARHSDYASHHGQYPASSSYDPTQQWHQHQAPPSYLPPAAAATQTSHIYPDSWPPFSLTSPAPPPSSGLGNGQRSMPRLGNGYSTATTSTPMSVGNILTSDYHPVSSKTHHASYDGRQSTTGSSTYPTANDLGATASSSWHAPNTGYPGYPTLSSTSTSSPQSLSLSASTPSPIVHPAAPTTVKKETLEASFIIESGTTNAPSSTHTASPSSSPSSSPYLSSAQSQIGLILGPPRSTVPLRATHACPEMRAMMSVFRLDPFACIINVGGEGVEGRKYEDEAGPLEVEPECFEWQCEGWVCEEDGEGPGVDGLIPFEEEEGWERGPSRLHQHHHYSGAGSHHSHSGWTGGMEEPDLRYPPSPEPRSLQRSHRHRQQQQHQQYPAIPAETPGRYSGPCVGEGGLCSSSAVSNARAQSFPTPAYTLAQSLFYDHPSQSHHSHSQRQRRPQSSSSSPSPNANFNYAAGYGGGGGGEYVRGEQQQQYSGIGYLS